MSDDGYRYWSSKLAGEDPDPPSNRMELPCGFWRLQRGEPLAVWMDGEQRIALRGFADAARPMSERMMETMAEQGGFGKAVTEEAYRQACALGRWPDTDPVVAAQTAPRRGMGDNHPPGDIDILREQIDAAKAGAADYAKIEDDETARRAQSLRSRLLELSREADKKRDDLKRPHLEAGKAVDAEWQPLVKSAKAAADDINRAQNAWENEKERRRQAEERARAKALAEARAAEEAGKPAPPVPPPPAPEPVVTQIRPGYGRAAAVKSIKVARIVDQDAVYAAFKTEPTVVDLLAKLAQRAVDNGHDVPGVEIEQQRKVV